MKRMATLLLITSVTVGSLVGSAAAQSGGASPAQPVLVGSNSVVGSAVRNPDGREIGKVSQLMLDPNDGRIVSVVVSTGGTLGVGANTISVPWSSVKIGQDSGKLIVIASQTLDSVPRPETAREAIPNQQPKTQ